MTTWIMGPVAIIELDPFAPRGAKTDLIQGGSTIPEAHLPFKTASLPEWINRMGIWNYDRPEDGPVVGYLLPLS